MKRNEWEVNMFYTISLLLAIGIIIGRLIFA